MTHAYNILYLEHSSRAIGNMLKFAVSEKGLDGSAFLECFIQSGVAEEIENGNPKYIAGYSGLELFLLVEEIATGKIIVADLNDNTEINDVYWVGWMITHYQWYSGRSFKTILDIIPYGEFLCLYKTLHEVSIEKCYEVLEVHFLDSKSKLKKVRNLCGITQEKLSRDSGVSLNTIRAYERKSKDINKAQFDIVMRLASALKCNLSDITE